MRIVILGSGSSLGVPVICCKCEVCTSNNHKNKRLRASILIQSEKANILVDTSPDFRYQALKNNINDIDAVFFTHAHYDHIAGINDLKAFAISKQSSIPIYSNHLTIEYFKKHYGYIFNDANSIKSYQSFLDANVVKYNDVLTIKDITIEIFEQIHGNIRSLGLKINNKIAYSTDVSDLSPTSIDVIKNVDIWIVDCIREQNEILTNHIEAHANLSQVLNWIEIIKPEKTILTHIGHTIDYNKLSKKLPKNISIAYDGMNIYLQ